jgi:hypothetical protein
LFQRRNLERNEGFALVWKTGREAYKVSGAKDSRGTHSPGAFDREHLGVDRIYSGRPWGTSIANAGIAGVTVG